MGFERPESVFVVAALVMFAVSVVISYRYCCAPPVNGLSALDAALGSATMLAAAFWVLSAVHRQIKEMAREVWRPPRKKRYSSIIRRT